MDEVTRRWTWISPLDDGDVKDNKAVENVNSSQTLPLDINDTIIVSCECMSYCQERDSVGRSTLQTVAELSILKPKGV